MSSREIGSAPTEASPGAGSHTLPSLHGHGVLSQELLARGADRLRSVAISCAALMTCSFVSVLVAPPATAASIPIASVAVGLCMVMSIGMWILCGTAIDRHRLLDIALIYQVLTGLGIALAEAFSTYDPNATVRGISWLCLWIAIFPLIVPSTTGKTTLVALTTAAMGPLALLCTVAAGVQAPDLRGWLLLSLPNLLSAGVAVSLSSVIHELRTDVSRARRMGSYQLESLLGHGGMGEVWRARHGVLGRPAAVKFARPEALAVRSQLHGAALLKRFRREAEVTAHLTSLHTVQLYDFGITEDGTLYYVMELLDGLDLETLITRHGPMSSARVARLLLQACESLAEAHERGIVHRDIKPANIFLCRLGMRTDCVKILDFGIAAREGDVGASHTRLTHTNALPGTPAYQSPEAVSGDQPVDGRSDLYALGCVAYWLLTGTRVFLGDTIGKLAIAHAIEVPERPSSRLGAPVDSTLERLILNCLAKAPAERPVSASALAAELAAVDVSGWSDVDADRWWKEHGPSTSEPRVSPARGEQRQA